MTIKQINWLRLLVAEYEELYADSPAGRTGSYPPVVTTMVYEVLSLADELEDHLNRTRRVVEWIREAGCLSAYETLYEN